VAQSYGTDEFGIVDAALTSGTRPTPFQYTGEPRDPETGLVYLRARSYDPAVGRFMQADPLRKSAPGVGGWNRFTYVSNNPVRHRDPSGLTPTGVDPEGGFQHIAQVAQPLTPQACTPVPPMYGLKLACLTITGVVIVGGAVIGGSVLIVSKAHEIAEGLLTAQTQNEADQGSDRVRGLPPPGVMPPNYDPETWRNGPASRPSEVARGGQSLYDPEGGEWRYFPEDEYHHPHWDYNPNTGGNPHPWENVPLEPGGPILK